MGFRWAFGYLALAGAAFAADCDPTPYEQFLREKGYPVTNPRPSAKVEPVSDGPAAVPALGPTAQTHNAHELQTAATLNRHLWSQEEDKFELVSRIERARSSLIDVPVFDGRIVSANGAPVANVALKGSHGNDINKLANRMMNAIKEVRYRYREFYTEQAWTDFFERQRISPSAAAKMRAQFALPPETSGRPLRMVYDLGTNNFIQSQGMRLRPDPRNPSHFHLQPAAGGPFTETHFDARYYQTFVGPDADPPLESITVLLSGQRVEVTPNGYHLIELP